MSDLNDSAILGQLPEGSTIAKVAFVPTAKEGQTVLAELPAPLNRRAVAFEQNADAELAFLSIPSSGDDAPVLSLARDWADPVNASGDRLNQWITLQGAQVIWGPGHIALMAADDRLPSARRAMLEVAYFDSELRAIENELASRWPEMEADVPVSFEFAARSIRIKQQLAERFRRVLLLRARLARITPHVLAPHAHPPTLASQLHERVRERLRMAHRVESISDQLDVFERVYEGCGQKASEFMLARTGHALEWVIIALLLSQTVLVCIDLLTQGK